YGSFLQRRVNVTACDLLRHHAELLQGLAGPAADAKFQPFEIIDGLDLLAEPAAHLRAGIPGDEAVGVEFFAELIHQLEPIAIEKPRVLLACVEPKWDGTEKCPGRVLANEIVGSRMASLDGAVLDSVEHLEAGHDLACGERLDLELVVGGLRQVFRKSLARPVERVERLLPAGG